MSSEAQSHGCDVVTRFCDCIVLRDGKLIRDDLFVRNGVFVDPEKLFYDEKTRETIRVPTNGCIIAPGFIDVQINGAIGFDFSTVPNDSASAETEYVANVRKVAAFLLRHGVTSFCPTLVSSSAQCYSKLLPLFRRAKQEQAELQTAHFGYPSFPSPAYSQTLVNTVNEILIDGKHIPAGKPEYEAQIIGLHLEGPFINREKKGAHDEIVLRTAKSMEDFDTVYGKEHLDGDLVRIITLAPELIGRNDEADAKTSQGSAGALNPVGENVIRELVARGIRVSIGHSNATFSDGESAVRAGATFVTHLFNCMQLFHHREPALLGLLTSETRAHNYVTTQSVRKWQPVPNKPPAQTSTLIPTSKLFFGVIADGVHTHHAALRLAHSAHQDGLVLVTDAIAALGLIDGAAPFRIGSRTVELIDGAPYIRGSNKSVLSGARVSMDECVRNYVRLANTTRVDALLAASTRPAHLLGLSHKGSLEPGAHADFVMLDNDLNVVATYIRGRCVYSRTPIG